MRTIVAWSLAAVVFVGGCTATGSAALPGEASDSAAPGSMASPEPGAPTAAEVPAERVVRLVTLGDAYTHGTGTDAPPRDSWPAQLTNVLRRSGYTVYPTNLAQPWTSSTNVLDEQVDLVESLEPDVVTVQVGINDILWGETDAYAQNLEAILERLLEFLPPERILAITTPDHTLTEWGKAYGPAEAVVSLNGILEKVADELGVTVVDIGPINRLVIVDPAMLMQRTPPVPDPSAKQYAGWAELIGLYVQDALALPEP